MTAAAKIRAALKIAGYNARKVTVREPHYGSVTVTIRDASVRISAVKEIAKGFEKIHRCEASGETLLGGNTYVDVEYLDTIIEPIAKDIAAQLAAKPGHVVALAEGIKVSADLGSEGWRSLADANVWRFGETGCGSFYCMGVNHAAERIAVELLDKGIAPIVAAVPVPVAA